MTRQEWIHWAVGQLETNNNPTSRLDAEVLLAHILGLERLQLHMYPAVAVDSSSATLFEHLVQRRTKGEPVAYLTGHQEFMGLDFNVSPDVLIPRPDTELLVESVLAYLQEEKAGEAKNNRPLAADIGTGSGCIAVSLAVLCPALTIMAVDLSAEALKVAGENSTKHQVADRVLLHQGDLLAPVKEWTDRERLLDVIVSNPPYITEEEMAQLDVSVAGYEPHGALAGGLEGLDFYRRLTEEAPALLRIGGLLAFEIGYEQGGVVAAMMKHQGLHQVQVLKDLAGLDRVVLGRR